MRSHFFAIMASKATLVPATHTRAHTPSRLPIQRAPHQPATLRSLLTHTAAPLSRASAAPLVRCPTRFHTVHHTQRLLQLTSRERAPHLHLVSCLLSLVSSTPRRSRRPSRSNPPPPSPPPPPPPHPHPSPRRQTPESSSPPPYAGQAWRRQTERRLHSSPP